MRIISLIIGIIGIITCIMGNIFILVILTMLLGNVDWSILNIIFAFETIEFVGALCGLILGIIDLVKKNKKNQENGVSIAGTVLSGIALIMNILMLFIYIKWYLV